MLRLKMLMLRR
jgi:hypothetical protein